MEYKIKMDSNKNSYGTLTAKIIDREGNVRRVHKQKLNSLVANYFRAVYAGLSKTSETIVDTNGDNSPGDYRGYRNQVRSGASPGDDSYGAVIGTGTTPVSIDDYSLESKIAHGSSAGQMDYKDCLVTDLDNQRTVQLGRTFENLSGSTITVGEVGWTAYYYAEFASSRRFKFLIIRDVLNSSLDVLSGESLQLTYELTIEPKIENRNGRVFTKVFAEPGNLTSYDVDGGTSTWDGLEILTLDTSEGAGLFVGIGDTAPTITELDLENQIEDGSSAGQLVHNNPSINFNVDISQDTVTLNISRSFTNQTESDIVIREVGLILTNGFGGPYMAGRHVFSNPPTIVAGTSRVVRWALDYSL